MRATAWIPGILLCLLSLGAAAQDSAAEKRALIRELIQMTGASKLATQFGAAVSENIARTLKQARPDIPERAFGILHQELVALFEERIDVPGGLMDGIIPIYEKHFTTSDLREIVAFYRSPIGRKTISVMPAVMQESMVAGQAWGQGLEPEIQRRVQNALRREGIKLPAN